PAIARALDGLAPHAGGQLFDLEIVVVGGDREHRDAADVARRHIPRGPDRVTATGLLVGGVDDHGHRHEGDEGRERDPPGSPGHYGPPSAGGTATASAVFTTRAFA